MVQPFLNGFLAIFNLPRQTWFSIVRNTYISAANKIQFACFTRDLLVYAMSHSQWTLDYRLGFFERLLLTVRSLHGTHTRLQSQRYVIPETVLCWHFQLVWLVISLV